MTSLAISLGAPIPSSEGITFPGNASKGASEDWREIGLVGTGEGGLGDAPCSVETALRVTAAGACTEGGGGNMVVVTAGGAAFKPRVGVVVWEERAAMVLKGISPSMITWLFSSWK